MSERLDERIRIKGKYTMWRRRKLIEQLNGIPWAAIVPILVLHLILMITAFVSCMREEKTKGPKWMWLLVILFINLIGPVLYFVIGRRND